MLSPKRLMKAASIGRRLRVPSISSSTTATTEKGHFVVYTVDNVRFMLPLSYLELGLFRELLRISEEEFGTSSDGPITLTCNAPSLEYMLLLIKRGVARDLEIKAMLDSIANQEFISPNMVMCGC